MAIKSIGAALIIYSRIVLNKPRVRNTTQLTAKHGSGLLDYFEKIANPIVLPQDKVTDEAALWNMLSHHPFFPKTFRKDSRKANTLIITVKEPHNHLNRITKQYLINTLRELSQNAWEGKTIGQVSGYTDKYIEDHFFKIDNLRLVFHAETKELIAFVGLKKMELPKGWNPFYLLEVGMVKSRYQEMSIAPYLNNLMYTDALAENGSKGFFVGTRTANPRVIGVFTSRMEDCYPNPYRPSYKPSREMIEIAKKVAKYLSPDKKFNPRTFVLENVYSPESGLIYNPSKIPWYTDDQVNTYCKKALGYKEMKGNTFIFVGRFDAKVALKHVLKKKTDKIKKIYRYLNNPTPDLLPALKIFMRSNFNARLVWELIKYFSNLTANKVPALRRLIGKQTEVDFSEYMQAYDNTTATFFPYQEMLSRIADMLELKGGEKVLDLGSGTGNLTLVVANKGGKVISVDNSPEANAIHRTKNKDAKILEVDLDQQSTKTGFIRLHTHSVDRVCAANVWTYIKNRKVLYAEIKRVLKEEGEFVLAVERTGYNPGSILKGHFYKAYDYLVKQGLPPLTALSQVISDFSSNLKSLLITAEQTKKLMRGIATGDYITFEPDEIIKELAENGFTPIEYEITYAGQAIIVKSRKIKV